MSRATDKGKIKAERTAHRKQAKRQRKADEKAKREAENMARIGIALRESIVDKRTTSDETERTTSDETERDFNRQLDELAARVKATIEADRDAGRETDLWEWLKDAPCCLTKALRERGISLGKRKK